MSIDNDVDLESFASPNCPIDIGTSSDKTTLTLKCGVAMQRLYRCSVFYDGVIFTVTNFTLSKIIRLIFHIHNVCVTVDNFV